MEKKYQKYQANKVWTVSSISPISGGIERPVTIAQLAAHLQVSVRTIARYREERLIPYWQINSRNIRYRISDVERALAKRDGWY
jgi:predicted DNA-binding transcriptional regulator YafY